jgi:chromosome partitioning protein
MMSVRVLTFFNNKGGVGKTTLVSHIATMMAQNQNLTIVVMDLDPQANLTASFLSEEALDQLWNDKNAPGGRTIFSCIQPLSGMGDILMPVTTQVAKGLHILPGAMELSRFEDELSETWIKCNNDAALERPFRIQTAFWQIAQMAASNVNADLVIVDVGPNLGAINRSALIASDFVIVPIGADLYSLQGLKNLGPAMREWRTQWKRRVDGWNNYKGNKPFELPVGSMEPLGYLLQQYSVRLDKPVKAYDRWVSKVPGVYQSNVLGRPLESSSLTTKDDPNCLAMIKHYRSLIPMSQEKRKRVFELNSADGAIGAHQKSVTDAFTDFKELSATIKLKMEIQSMLGSSFSPDVQS